MALPELAPALHEPRITQSMAVPDKDDNELPLRKSLGNLQKCGGIPLTELDWHVKWLCTAVRPLPQASTAKHNSFVAMRA
jgi:hypothetical protein